MVVFKPVSHFSEWSMSQYSSSMHCIKWRGLYHGSIVYFSSHCCYIAGTSEFSSYFTINTGLVVVAMSSNFYFLTTTTSMKRAAFSLYQDWSEYFAQGANILFENNLVQLSEGAIYSSTLGNQCSLQPYPLAQNLNQVSPHTNITFNHNQATVLGNS